MAKEKQLYEVKVKDNVQDVTHTVHEWAQSQREANVQAVGELRALLGYDDLELL